VPGESYAAYMSTEPGNDPIGDFQRWLMRAGAKSMGREVAGRVRSTFGPGGGASRGRSKPSDVWDTATTEVLTDEPPECQWCPICRAARRYRDSGGPAPTLGGQFVGVGDTLAGLTRDAFGLFDAAVRAAQTPRPPGSPSAPSASSPAPAPPAAPQPGPAEGSGSSDDGAVVGSGVGWPSVVHPQHQDDETADKGGDREERGEPGDGSAGSGADEQVERPAE
jgi:hypothetical protein